MKEYFSIAINNLKHAEKRTWLTIIGIFIGIAAVVALISVGQGLENSIDEQFSKIGTDKLFIASSQDMAFGGTGGGDISNPLKEDDVEVIKRVRGVERVAAWTLRTAKVEVGDDLGFYYVAGISLDSEKYNLVRDLIPVDVQEGRELRPGDKGSVLLGNSYLQEDQYENPLSPGDRILINDKKYTTAGILEAQGNSIDDHIIWMELGEFEELFDVQKQVSQIIVQVSPGENPVAVADVIERDLLDHRGLDEEEKDFDVSTPEELLESFNTILTIVRVVLIGIAAISLLVGGIGIMNTMYTAVLERTKEIGIMKAIGATPRAIQNIFLVEAGMLGLGGGMIGVLIGLGIAKLVEAIGRAAMKNDFLSAYISWELIIGALLFSTIVGMLSGFLPARQASQQNVVDSLRYE